MGSCTRRILRTATKYGAAKLLIYEFLCVFWNEIKDTRFCTLVNNDNLLLSFQTIFDDSKDNQFGVSHIYIVI